MNLIQAIILAIVEGLTEFIPVSSTGHLVLISNLLKVPQDDFVRLYEVAIQFGAILAVVVLYSKMFFNFKNPKFYLKLIVATIPALIIGFIFSDKIDSALGNSISTAIILIIGGFVLLGVDPLFKKVHQKKPPNNKISFKRAFAIGIWETLAILFPGTSRSAATIIGGLQQGLTKKLATEFSFLIAVPAMAAATSYKFLKFFKDDLSLSGGEVINLALGNIIAFIVAILAIKLFISAVKRYGFLPWGVYRIVVGVGFLLYFLES
jgi:undecaprenyl-diphosphatase